MVGVGVYLQRWGLDFGGGVGGGGGSGIGGYIKEESRLKVERGCREQRREGGVGISQKGVVYVWGLVGRQFICLGLFWLLFFESLVEKEVIIEGMGIKRVLVVLLEYLDLVVFEDQY